MDRETQSFSLVAAGGVVSTTGVAGLTLGGGYGWARRKLGLSCDTLVSVELVTADGRLLTASPTVNPDLFWALKGGGGNFGIVVWFEFELFELGPEVFYVAAMYPGERAVQVLKSWRDVVEQAPDEITSDVSFTSVPQLPDIPKELHDRPVVFVEAVYAGDISRAGEAMLPLRQLDEPLLDASGPVQWLEIQSSLDPLVPAVTQQYYWKSLYMQELSDQAIQALADRCVERPSPRTLVPIRHLGGAIARVGPTQTPLGDRSSKYLLSLDSIWSDPGQAEANVAWTRQVWKDMQPFSARNAVYLNFAGLGEEGQDLLQGAYQKNYDRLVAVKTRYDPDNFFHHNHNIPPAE